MNDMTNKDWGAGLLPPEWLAGGKAAAPVRLMKTDTRYAAISVEEISSRIEKSRAALKESGADAKERKRFSDRARNLLGFRKVMTGAYGWPPKTTE